MVLCKDCKYVKKETLHRDEASVECSKFTEDVKSHISPVTGSEYKGAPIQRFCKYERTLGFCQEGQFFEEDLNG